MRNMKKGFSLIEVLIAIAIAALAASLIYPVVKGNKDKAGYKISVLNLVEVGKAMEKHYLERGKFPVFADWSELSGAESPLLEYINEIPATDAFGKAYRIVKSSEEEYEFEGFGLPGKMKVDFPDYTYVNGKLKKKGQKN